MSYGPVSSVEHVRKAPGRAELPSATDGPQILRVYPLLPTHPRSLLRFLWDLPRPARAHASGPGTSLGRTGIHERSTK